MSSRQAEHHESDTLEELPAYHDGTAYIEHGDAYLQPVEPLTAPPPEYPLLPRDTIVYKDEYMNFAIGTMHEEPRLRPLPLFYVSVSYAKNKKGQPPIPQITFSNGPDATSPTIASVQFRSITSDITIFHRTYNSKIPFDTTTIPLSSGSGSAYSTASSFTIGIPSPDGTSRINERYTWMESKDDDVTALMNDNPHAGQMFNRTKRGLKLVQDSTKEKIAIWAPGTYNSTDNPLKIAAKLRFLDGGMVSEELQILALLTVLTRAERVRRSQGTLMSSKNPNSSCCVS